MLENNFELKSGLLSVKSIAIKDNNLKELESYIKRSVLQAPFMFKYTPFFVDVNEIKNLEFNQLLSIYRKAEEIFRKFEIFPLGVKNCKKSYKAEFNKNGVLVFLDISSQSSSMAGGSASNKEISDSKEEKTVEVVKEVIIEKIVEKLVTNYDLEPLIHDGVVRGGQQLYAENRDLIIFGHVNHGAEVIAGRNLIIFGTGEGRLAAGVESSDAVIIAGKFKPSLVSICGNYKTIEETDTMFGKSNVLIEYKDNNFIMKEMSV